MLPNERIIMEFRFFLYVLKYIRINYVYKKTLYKKISFEKCEFLLEELRRKYVEGP